MPWAAGGGQLTAAPCSVKPAGSICSRGLAARAGKRQVKPRQSQLTVPPFLPSSLQNVLLQMGLHVLAVNGMLIRQARSYILRCHGCFK